MASRPLNPIAILKSTIDLPMRGADKKVILAIEASGPDASVAVGRAGSLLHLEPVAHGARHDDDLMPAVARAFDRIAAAPQSLAEVYISIGPGGFTGLRIAIATAKMLALATGCRIVAVPECLAAAEAVAIGSGGTDLAPVAVCLAGKQGEFWCAISPTIGRSEGHVLTAAEVIRQASDAGITRICISQPLDSVAQLVAQARAAALEVVESHPDALQVFAVGRRLAESGCFISAPQLAPIYPREPEAVRIWRQRQAQSPQ